MIVVYAMSASAQDVPKKPEAIPPSGATAPAETNIPWQEQKPEAAKTAMQQKSHVKAAQGKKRAKTGSKVKAATKDVGNK